METGWSSLNCQILDLGQILTLEKGHDFASYFIHEW